MYVTIIIGMAIRNITMIKIKITKAGCGRGTQRIVSVNYLFGRPLIPSDFLETFVTLNFRDMRNLMSVAFGLSKLSFLVPKKGQLSFRKGEKT